MPELSVIIPAAGSGVRMGASKPKPFLELGEKPILEHTINGFLHVPHTCQVIVATSPEYIPEVEKLFNRIEASSAIDFLAVEGGKERQYSIYNALQKVHPASNIVAVHDAVRPFIRPALVERCCQIANETGGAIIGVPAKDTIKKVKEGNIVEATPDRSKLWQAQTPQVFQKQLLLDAYEAAFEENFEGTDDASLVERIGGKVTMVEGDRENLKITFPIDLEVAELILANWKYT